MKELNFRKYTDNFVFRYICFTTKLIEHIKDFISLNRLFKDLKYFDLEFTEL